MKKILITLLVVLLITGCSKTEEIQTEYTNDLATLIDEEIKSYVVKDDEGNVVEVYELDKEYLIEYTLVTDKKLNIKLTMVDTTAPVITINEDALIVEAKTEIGELFSVIDNYDQNVEIKQDNLIDTNILGETVINIEAIDKSGNKSNESINVIVKDTTIPKLDVIKDAFNYNVGNKNPKFETGAKGFDEFDGDLEVTIEGDWNSSKAGKYELYYVATDKSGNSAKAPFTVTYKNVNNSTGTTGGNSGGNTGGNTGGNVLCAGGMDPSKPCDEYVGNLDGVFELFKGDDENMTACKARGESLLGDATENDYFSYFCSTMKRNDYKHWGSGLMMRKEGN